MGETLWKLKPGINMEPATAVEVAKIACALKSLSIYVPMIMEDEASQDAKFLKQVVDEGLDALAKMYEW